QAQDRVVRDVSFEGNHAIDDNTLRISIGTSWSSWWQRTLLVPHLFGEKRYFDETEFRRDVLRLTLLYRQSGFFEATIDTVVKRGPRARIGEIIVDGAQKIAAGVVRRAAGLHPGDLYRKEALARSQIELYRTDLFNHVNVALADSTPPAGDSAVRVRIEVAEGKLYGTRAGAGYGVQDCFRGLAGVTARDFLGGGRSLDVTGKVSKIVTERVCPGLAGE